MRILFILISLVISQTALAKDPQKNAQQKVWTDDYQYVEAEKTVPDLDSEIKK